MKEKDFIPGIKYTTKEDLKKELDQKQLEFEQLKYEKIQLQEKLYESGIEKRPTIMDQIEKKEEEARKTIRYIIEECEKETGRAFPKIWFSKQQVDFYNSLNKAEM